MNYTTLILHNVVILKGEFLSYDRINIVLMPPVVTGIA